MILITGGLGYIGSHIAVCLLSAEKQFDIVILDNLSNSELSTLDNIQSITSKKPIFVEGDIRDTRVLKQIFEDYPIKAVIHLANLKSIPESISKPLEYYDNNVNGTTNLLTEMKNHGVFNLIFSSSASVYGQPDKMPIKETQPKNPLSPYAKTKAVIENILRDVFISEGFEMKQEREREYPWNFVIFRYFNPIGAHPSGLIGDCSKDNLVPRITRAIKNNETVSIFGNTYSTLDGTCVRDFIHICDIADAHVLAVEYVLKYNRIFEIFNLGTNIENSVLDIIKMYRKVSHLEILIEMKDKRPGDAQILIADPKKAEKILNWKATRNLEEAITSEWNFAQKCKYGDNLFINSYF